MTPGEDAQAVDMPPEEVAWSELAEVIRRKEATGMTGAAFLSHLRAERDKAQRAVEVAEAAGLMASAMKPRKTRSDKGTKRGPRTADSADAKEG